MIGASFLWAFLILVIKKISSMNPHFLVLRSTGTNEQVLDPVNFKSKQARTELNFALLQGSFWVLALLPLGLVLCLKPVPFIEISLWFLVLNASLAMIHMKVIKITLEGSSEFRSFLFRLNRKVRESMSFVLEWETSLHEVFSVHREFGVLVEAFRSSILQSSMLMIQQKEERSLEVEERRIFNQLEGLFYTSVSLVMTPVSRVLTVPSSFTVRKALEYSSLHGHSRYPVLDDAQRVLGIFRANQLSLAREENLKVTDRIDDEIRIQSGKSCYEALEILQNNKRQIGLVYEKEQWLGLVSVEDLLEEFVGEISDEFDESDLRKISADSFVANASISIPKLHQYFSEPFENNQSSTLNEFLVGHFGKIPSRQAVVVLKTIRLTVLETDKTRIISVRIQRLKNNQKGLDAS